MKVALTTKFKRDVKLAKRRGKDLEKIWRIAEQLGDGIELDAWHRSHPLRGNWVNHWECRIESDWLLVWSVRDEELILARTGSHSDLFG